MDIDDLEPRKKTATPLNLDNLSIEELGEYVASLEAEIARARAKIEAKKAHLAGAATLFREG